MLIDLQQRELDLYKKLRKGLLQKLFPSDGENVPIVRFADFDENWKQYKLHQIFQYEQPSKYIVTSTDYNTNYEIPVLTAGKSFILGYSNEHYGIKSANKNNPIIIFDDFTVGMHYVDFPFKVKSSAMKLISLKSNDNNSIFMYYILKKIHYVPQGHERQWISKFSQFDTLIPFTSEQNKIGDILNNIDKLLKSRKYKLNEISMLKKYYLQKLFI
ncbi:restriction endonuclease subunit S [Companilactobacillus kedongensis]|uniref:restriction endonuclease subunit S n=1 Tax=Companilactobacillus kedongensis TaxID=2486004 RepID=UPI001CDD165C|nr:restriction endonuclease subunit S [Companilactobacillus kedongensis]